MARVDWRSNHSEFVHEMTTGHQDEGRNGEWHVSIGRLDVCSQANTDRNITLLARDWMLVRLPLCVTPQWSL
ncbi:MAG: hypothetical protein DWI00_04545 [Planctomycetota bacterium]|nr:MAG: hypothetical protein DWI00_04545 [Planctomycetota bacterium]